MVRAVFDVEAIVRLRTGDFVVEWDGRFDRIREELDLQTRTLRVVIAVDRPYENVVPGKRPPLSPGMFCEVELRGQPRPDQVVVPRGSVRDGAVYLVNDANRLERRPVEVAFSQGGFSVISEGLPAASGWWSPIRRRRSKACWSRRPLTRRCGTAARRGDGGERRAMIEYFARHPTAANLLMIGLVAMGLLTVSELRRETFPDITPSEVQVRVIYPGATAEEVEEAVCQRIEDALDGVRFVKELRSDAREGLATVTAEMAEGGDFTTFLTTSSPRSMRSTTSPTTSRNRSCRSWARPTRCSRWSFRPDDRPRSEGLLRAAEGSSAVAARYLAGEDRRVLRPPAARRAVGRGADAFRPEPGGRRADHRAAERRPAGRAAGDQRAGLLDSLRRTTPHAARAGGPGDRRGPGGAEVRLGEIVARCAICSSIAEDKVLLDGQRAAIGPRSRRRRTRT